MTSTKKQAARIPTSERFEFLDEIGRGGMGIVYRALDRQTQAHVAIKVLHQKLSDNPIAVQRFQREFRAAHELDHPNIVRALAFETDGTSTFVAFELFQGTSLGDWLDDNGPLNEADAIRYITQVAQALYYAHERQVVHRDVKPDNILLLPDGRVKLTDFGLVKDHSETGEPDLTRQASGLGTPHYMAPEQFSDAKHAGPLCDVYSLGATLYNLLTCKLPYDAKSPLAIFTKKQTGQLEPVRRFAPAISEHVEVAIRASVDPEPSKRPQSCLEFFKGLTSPFASRASLTATPMPSLPRQIRLDANRRNNARFPLKLGTLAVIETGAGSEEHWPVIVQDLSAGGCRILLARRFEKGSEFEIELFDKLLHRFTVHVLRVKPEQAGHWIHGCTFVKSLSESELKLLIKSCS